MRGVVATTSFLIAFAALLALPHASRGADAADATQWTASATAVSCKLTSKATGPDAEPGGTLQITWNRGDAITLMVSISPSAPAGRWRIDSVGKGGQQEIFSGKDKFLWVSREIGEKVKLDLAAGRAVNLTIETRSGSRRYTTGTRGLAASLREFDKCVADIKAIPEPPPPPPRWTAETQGGRDCSLSISSKDVPGLDALFRARHRTPMSFNVMAWQTHFPDGGILRVALPGVAQPWVIDTTKQPAASDPRAATLLAELTRLKPPAMTFTPHGGKTIALRTVTDGLAVASAMFNACAAALGPETLPPRLSFTELRYVVYEYDNACELTGTFQIDGNGIWLTLVSDGKKNLFKVTRRTIKSGHVIASLGLADLGGPKKLTAADATFEIDAPAFTALRRDLVDKGRDFHIMMTRDNGYTGQFGGAFAVVEAPMFEACAHAKFDAR